MAETTSEILVGANGSIHVAPLGSTVPTDATSAYDAAFAELGFTTDAGVKLHDGKTVVPIPVWQSYYPARRIVTAHEFTAAFALVQWNKNTVPLAFGGGTITHPAGGVWKYAAPSPGLVDERVLGVDWQDGSKHYRLIIPRGMVTDAVDAEVVRTKESDLPIVFAVTCDGTTDPWYLLTDDPSFS